MKILHIDAKFFLPSLSCKTINDYYFNYRDYMLLSLKQMVWDRTDFVLISSKDIKKILWIFI
jgi:hypothetical protein